MFVLPQHISGSTKTEACRLMRKLACGYFLETIRAGRSAKNQVKGVLEQEPRNINPKLYEDMLFQHFIYQIFSN